LGNRRGEMKMQILDITDSVYINYKKVVKGSRYITKEQAAKKLTRNMLLSLPTKRTKDGQGVVYAYGHMRFMVKNNTVEWLEDDHKKLPMWFLDKEKHEQLTVELGIYEYTKVERTKMEEIKTVGHKKEKQMQEARKHLRYLKRDLQSVIGKDESKSWIIDNVDTILSIIEKDDSVWIMSN
jgi:hypothetical protein